VILAGDADLMSWVRAIRLIAATLLLLVWAYVTFLFWITPALMSVDEEWEGWGDALLDPYIVGAYALATIMTVGGAILLMRGQFRPHESRPPDLGTGP
jgi:hypothetical protein